MTEIASFISVDPGIRHSGVAMFKGGILRAAALVKNPIPKGDDAAACLAMADAIGTWALGQGVGWREVVVERMQSYDPSRQKGDQNDLITLSIVAGMLRPTWMYLPRQWKGQVPKDIMAGRIVSELSEDEEKRIERAGVLTHNIIDAVGIGLHHLSRLGPRKVLAFPPCDSSTRKRSLKP